MKKRILVFAWILIISVAVSCDDGSNNSSNNSSNSTPTYTKPVKKCKPSTSKVRRLVRTNWASIKRIADFTVSSKKSFEITKYGLDGDELAVEVFSKGYMYDISFTVSFDANFDDNCSLYGNVTDVYNYVKN